MENAWRVVVTRLDSISVLYWLAFAHIVIAIAFVGPPRDPVRNVWVIELALIDFILPFRPGMRCEPPKPGDQGAAHRDLGSVGYLQLLVDGEPVGERFRVSVSKQ